MSPICAQGLSDIGINMVTCLMGEQCEGEESHTATIMTLLLWPQGPSTPSSAACLKVTPPYMAQMLLKA